MSTLGGSSLKRSESETGSTGTRFPEAPGSYVLVLEATRCRRIEVGALGRLPLEPGFYAYSGSARGPGGLAGRLKHHLGRSRKPHWHIDYLRRQTAVREVWFSETGHNCEHLWARVLAEMEGANLPLAGFGASDCRCTTHLVRFASRPDLAVFNRSQREGVRWVTIGNGKQ